jgi:hypothetical protein
VPTTIDDLGRNLQKFFADKFPSGDAETAGAVALVLDALGTPLDSAEFIGSGTDAAVNILAHQRAAQLADQIPAVNMLANGWYVAKSGSQLSRWYDEMLSSSSAISTLVPDMEAFERRKARAFHAFGTNKLPVLSGTALGGTGGTVDTGGTHQDYYATSMSPVNWYQADSSSWETYSDKSQNLPVIPVDTPPFDGPRWFPAQQFSLRIANEITNPDMTQFVSHAVATGVVGPTLQADPAVAMATDNIQEAVSPELSKAVFERAKFKQNRRMFDLAADTPMAALTVEQPAFKVASATALPISNLVEIIGQKIAPVEETLAFPTERFEQLIDKFQLFDSAAVVDATATQTPSSDNFQISFEYCLVRFDRPWWDEVFVSSQGWKMFGFEAGDVASGSVRTPSELITLITIGMVVVKNLIITATWSADDKGALARATSIGPFCIAGSKFDNSNGTLTRPGMQAVGWLCQVPPSIPPRHI